jgi:hypothetical protein
MSGDLLEIAECCLPMPTSIGSSEHSWKVFSWIQSKKRNRFEQERASRLAHVNWSLRYQARLTDPRYEELILPDVTENLNPKACTDNVWDGAVTDELDDKEELVTRMGNAEARSMHGCVIFSATSNNLIGQQIRFVPPHTSLLRGPVRAPSPLAH